MQWLHAEKKRRKEIFGSGQSKVFARCNGERKTSLSNYFSCPKSLHFKTQLQQRSSAGRPKTWPARWTSAHWSTWPLSRPTTAFALTNWPGLSKISWSSFLVTTAPSTTWPTETSGSWSSFLSTTSFRRRRDLRWWTFAGSWLTILACKLASVLSKPTLILLGCLALGKVYSTGLIISLAYLVHS